MGASFHLFPWVPCHHEGVAVLPYHDPFQEVQDQEADLTFLEEVEAAMDDLPSCELGVPWVGVDGGPEVPFFHVVGASCGEEGDP